MKIRFVVKKIQNGPRSYEYRVYDNQRGSFPYQIPELGTVAQDHKAEKDAQAECDRLTEKFGYVTPQKTSKKPPPREKADDED